MREVDKELFDAVRQGNLSRVKRCIDRGANVNAKDTDGNTTLINAAFYGHKNVAEFLLNQGLSINGPGLNNFTPLHAAAEEGYLGSVNKISS